MSDQIPLHVVFVEAWIKKGDAYLLAKRSSKDDQAAGHWAVPGGKVELGVDDDIIEKSLRREVLEEVGVEIGNIQFISSKSFIRSSGHNVIGLSFVAQYKSGEPRPLEDQDEIRWVTIQEMTDLLEPYWASTIDKLSAANPS
jgi:8-oxo-dGTP diphosphatase